jgi:ketosteroid isomerase-like protein
MLDRRSLLLSGLVLGATTFAHAHPHGVLDAERHSDIERQINAFREGLKTAAAAKDIARLRGMYAEAFTHTHTTGQVDGRETRITHVAGGDHPVIELAPVTELSMRIHGPDLVIVSGRSPIMNRRENRMVQVRWMQVMTRAEGEWRLASSMAVRLPDTA